MTKIIGNDYLTPKEFRETIKKGKMPLPFCLEDVVHQITGLINGHNDPEEIFTLYCNMYSLTYFQNSNLRILINRTINLAVMKRDAALVPKLVDTLSL